MTEKTQFEPTRQDEIAEDDTKATVVLTRSEVATLAQHYAEQVRVALSLGMACGDALDRLRNLSDLLATMPRPGPTIERGRIPGGAVVGTLGGANAFSA